MSILRLLVVLLYLLVGVAYLFDGLLLLFQQGLQPPMWYSIVAIGVLRFSEGTFFWFRTMDQETEGQ